MQQKEAAPQPLRAAFFITGVLFLSLFFFYCSHIGIDVRKDKVKLPSLGT
jgi:hypothetical protein